VIGVELVFAALVTGMFGVLLEVLRRFWRGNRRDHDVVLERLDGLGEGVSGLRGDVGVLRGEVSGLRRDHERLVDRFEGRVDGRN